MWAPHIHEVTICLAPTSSRISTASTRRCAGNHYSAPSTILLLRAANLSGGSRTSRTLRPARLLPALLLCEPATNALLGFSYQVITSLPAAGLLAEEQTSLTAPLTPP